MKNERPPRYWSICLFLAFSWSLAAAPLSYTNIKSLYKEGEFEKIKVTLETFLKQNGNSAQTMDRIFAYKYLGVTYAAEPKLAPVAESYFYQLLELAPNAHVSDLYVSTAVSNLFEKTKERFLKENRENTEFDEFGNPRVHPTPVKGPSDRPPKQDTLGYPYTRKNPEPIPDSRKPPGKEPKIRVWPWVLGGVAIAAVGGLWWYSSQKANGKKTVIDVNQ
jgi:tetratricopeptide (TPR) repeat protein